MRHLTWTLLWLAAALPSRAAAIAETFGTEPAPREWRAFGNTSLFNWNSTNQNLEITWDSSRTNSLFYRPLRTVLTKTDDFGLGFDLRLRDIAIGVNTNKPYTFEIAIGLCRFNSITNKNFFRGAGTSLAFGPRNLIEFDYFPDSGFGATVAPTAVANTNAIRFSDNHPLELTTDDLFRIDMTYTASNQVLRTMMTRNGSAFGPIRDLSLANFPDFRVDTFAAISYSDAMQTPPQFAGSILAHGVVDNITWSVPDPPLISFRGDFAQSGFRAEVNARSNWIYRLETSSDLLDWSFVEAKQFATNGSMFLEHREISTPRNFYRVSTDRP
jgi:hypothetical protein